MTATAIKSNTMTAREYAHSLGLAKLGRGRLSPAAKAAIAKAESEGVTFKPSASEVAKAEAEKRRAEGRTRKPKAKTPQTGSVVREGKFSSKVVVSDYDGKQLHPSAAWFKKTFYVGAYVCDPNGRTLFCISNEPDSEGWTRFVDKAGKLWKYKVNAMWGTRNGWSDGGASVSENAA